MPVNSVKFYDVLRFANWLHNGQPTGAQDNSTTEDGAYTITAEGIENNTITRNMGAKAFLPSENEWYKAAYYDTALDIYYDYPTGSDTQTTCAMPGATANTANCHGAADNFLTDVGSYTNSASPNGTFDQGGNVSEWSEAIISDSFRGTRGGSFQHVEVPVASQAEPETPNYDHIFLGFRVASRVPLVPSVSPVGMAMLGGLVFGIGAVGLVIAARRHRG